MGHMEQLPLWQQHLQDTAKLSSDFTFWGIFCPYSKPSWHVILALGLLPAARVSLMGTTARATATGLPEHPSAGCPRDVTFGKDGRTVALAGAR